MIPCWMQMKIPKKNETPATLTIPIFILWILLFMVLVLILPVWLIASFILILAGYGWTGFLTLGLLCQVFWTLQGLEVDVKTKDITVYFKLI
ncbi:hypothetical protein JW835_08460 [bacterium]|nr:hypothetical protein [bacterium]